MWPIEKLRVWDKNPRAIKKEDFDRLKRQIQELGQYKPLIITSDGEVLGGNMRLRAYQELGIKECWVSIVEPKDEAEKIKFALSDNDRAGYYVEQQLAELIAGIKDKINLEDYKVDLNVPFNLQQVLDHFSPSDFDEAERLDRLTEKDKVTCPKCGHEFTP